MIIVHTKKFIPVDNVQHIATTWEIASDKEFTDIVERFPRSDMLNSLFSKLVLPKDMSYWVKARFHFNDAQLDYDLDPIKVDNIEESYGEMILSEDIVVEQPYVYVEKDDILNYVGENPTILVRSSKMKCKVGGHAATHWFVYDGFNKLLWSSINDTENLKSINIPNLPVFRTKNKLRFACIHRDITGAESKAGFKDIVFRSNVNFEILTTLTNLVPFQPLEIKIKTINEKMSHGISEAWLTSFDNPDSGDKKELEITDNSIKIHWSMITPKTRYKLRIVHRYSTSLLNETIDYDVSVSDVNDDIIKDINHVVKHELVRSSGELIRSPNNIYIEADRKNRILIPSVRYNNMYIYNWDNTNRVLIKPKMFANGITLPDNTYDYFILKQLTKDRILIDMSVNNIPTFFVYDYNAGLDAYNLIHKVERDLEYLPLGKTGSIVQVSPDEVIYNPPDTDLMKSLNLKSGVISSLPNIPLVGIVKGLLIRLRNNRILVCNGVNYEAVVYNVEKATYSSGYTFGPRSFVNANNIVYPLLNGGSLIYKHEIDNDAEGNFTYYNYQDSKQVIPKITIGNRKPDLSIILANGNVVWTYKQMNDGSKDSPDTTEYLIYQ